MKLLFLLTTASAFAAPVRFDFRDAAQRNSVVITSDAPLERTVGITNYVIGWAETDPANVGQLRGEFEVDLRSFETLLPSKNEKIRDGFLKPGDDVMGKILFSKAGPKGGDIQVVLKKQNLPVRGEIKAQYFPKSDKTALRLAGNLLKLLLQFELDLEPLVKLSPVQWNLLSKKLSVSLDAVGTDSEPPSQIPVISAPKAK